MARKSEKRIKTAKVFVRVSPDELMHLRALSTTCGMSVPELMRVSTLSNRAVTIIDKEPLRDLMKVSADLGRLGGLLKLWLSEYEHLRGIKSPRKYEIRAVLEEVSATNTALKQKLNTLL